MATGDLALGQEQGQLSARQRVTNDFSINVATVNGSGSQSANSVLLKSIFGMGVPVSGKNLFPSNIAGLPTWYTIRASKDGYVARKRDSEVLVALNPETAREDALALPSGGVAIYEEKLDLKQYRDDVVFYPVPFDKITAAICPEAKLRKLVRNMVYVGAVAQILTIDLSVVESGLRKQFAKKQKVFELNFGAVKAGFDYAQTTFTKQDPYFIEPMDRDDGQDHHRRQRGVRHGRGVCRRDGGGVVSDYAFDLGGGSDDGPAEEVSRDAGRQGDVCRGAGRGRAGGDRHGAGRGLGGRAVDDRDLGAGHLADGRVHRAGLLRRDSGRDLRCAADGAFDGHADAHLAGRFAVDGVSFARRHQAYCAAAGQGEGVLRTGRMRPSTWPSGCRRRCLC